jgi:hypothetical protein
MTAAGRSSLSSVERIVDSLSQRDRAVVADVARTRVMTGGQITRLHFSDLSLATRERTRRRVLARLVALDVVTTLERRIGGVRAGSSGLIYSLGVAGQRALPLLAADNLPEPPARIRRPWTPGRLFLAHSLAGTELYVRLREHERAGDLRLAAFSVEPAAWWPSGMGGLVKPDAYALLHATEVQDSWWVEVDRATESLPTIRRKLLAYVDFARTGQLGPDGVTPRVLVTAPHGTRRSAITDLVKQLPPPADALFRVALHDQAAAFLVAMLHE